MLENHYAGDEAWNEFLKTYRDNCPAVQIDDDLRLKLADSEVSSVLTCMMGDRALRWIQKQVPALDGLTAVECIEKGLVNRLREAIMRM
jgi:hypothetical protein